MSDLPMPGTTNEASSTASQPRLTPMSLFFVLLLLWSLTQIQLVLVLGLLALLFGTILEGPVQFFQKRRFPRPAAILAVYVIIIGSLALLLVAIVPVIASQASEFSDDVPDLLRELEADWTTSSNPLLSGPGDQLLQRAIETFEGPSNVSPDAVDRAIPVVTSITGGLVSTLTLLVMTFYYLLEKRLLRRLILESLSPRFQPRVDRLWTEVEIKVGGWMRGQLLLCLIIGSIATVSYGIIGLDFWPLLGLWAGITEIVPIIGPWIGGVPAVLIALTISWKVALITGIVIVAMQSLENWVLVPRVMRGAVGLTPLTVFVAILAGTQLMGVIGAVLAIPIAATIQVLLTDYLDRRRDRDSHMSAREGWRWMLARSGLREAGQEDDAEVSWRDEPYASRDFSEDDIYPSQQVSESFTVRPNAGSDSAERDGENEEVQIDSPIANDDATIPEPADPEPDHVEVTSPEEVRDTDDGPGQRHHDTHSEPDDDPPAFAAWPRLAASDRKKSPSSTWPPLEEGRKNRPRKGPSNQDE